MVSHMVLIQVDPLQVIDQKVQKDQKDQKDPLQVVLQMERDTRKKRSQSQVRNQEVYELCSFSNSNSTSNILTNHLS